MAEDDFFYAEPIYRNLHKYVFSLDLQRFALDDFGSSIDSGHVYIQI
jgi:hypothetical protein